MCENVEKQTLSWRPPVPTTLTLFIPEEIHKNITCLRFPKISNFSTRADISGAIFIYTLELSFWDTLYKKLNIYRNSHLM